MIIVSAVQATATATVTPDMLPSPKDMLHGKDAKKQDIQGPAQAPAVASEPDAINARAYAGRDENRLPSAGSLSPDRKSPQVAGEYIEWTGLAADPEGDQLFYQFWLNGPSTGNTWRPMTNWSESNLWIWKTHPADAGNNIIDMRVRDGYHAGLNGWDSHISAEFFINGNDIESANSKPYVHSIKSDRQSPQDQGPKVTWTTLAMDDDGDTIFYQYWLKGPSTEEQWVPVTLWTTKNTWIWNTAQAKGGIYSVEVRVRDGYHEGTESSDDFERMAYIIRQTGIIK